MRNLKTQGIIIKRHNVNEADRIVTMYTRDMGKISLKAAGVRRITSKRASHIELLNYATVSLYKAAGMPVLVEAQMLNSFAQIKNDLQKVGFAYHICELIDGLCPEGQEQAAIFDLFKDTLNELSLMQGDEIVFTIHDFEVELLSLLGFWHKRPASSTELDTHHFIENILERKLKSHRIFVKL
ncbi:MAG TPA: DNA repair protein RecO [Patescibacteria group bacterium]|nr:DNA repair protein RecO [Patescibacteria group bacterium]